MPHHDEIINPFIKLHNFNVTWINLDFDFAYMVEVSFVKTRFRLQIKQIIVTFAPPVKYGHQYLFTAYPKEKGKFWNLTNLFTPTSWLMTFIAILSTCVRKNIYFH